MRALFYKDCYVMYKYNRLLLLLVLLFAVIAGKNIENMFFAVYPPAIMSAMSFSSLSYDERSGWLQYADCLPYGRKKIVASKYLLGLIGCLILMVLVLASEAVFGLISASINVAQMGMVMLIILVGVTLYMGIMLPVAFRFGTERARLLHIFLTVLLLCSSFLAPQPKAIPQISWGLAVALLVSGLLLIWSISYWASIKGYQNRNL